MTTSRHLTLRNTVVQPLYARLSAAEQGRVWATIPQRRVILATNVAESSVTLPGVRVAQTVYRGPYEGLGAAWGAFMAWIAAQHLQTGPGLWECYAAGPEVSPNPADWITELNCPVSDRS